MYCQVMVCLAVVEEDFGIGLHSTHQYILKAGSSSQFIGATHIVMAYVADLSQLTGTGVPSVSNRSSCLKHRNFLKGREGRGLFAM